MLLISQNVWVCYILVYETCFTCIVKGDNLSASAVQSKQTFMNFTKLYFKTYPNLKENINSDVA